ncbi:MAG: 1-acyl-sn-glycerol-3-phosphate acyltransferase [Gammaproteobacteria bacterium]|jgi:1-acyl-sn-glycerol-3-phosphate acyltransferase|nr:1-acyl-sn-glycerol-3-phosphate acyltransferase [Gammaproteobacteria bacterium]MDH3749198.1 1-acyl-sn-glycerol-3-phosphate acyltransferase [Gammaproteobacteria bacterium]MDH3805358.1 1-acyl-sn-glycerol-3-phosphate acyltransferase [Gammaproteobacteria bacterium]
MVTLRSLIFTFLLFASAILLSGMELVFFWAPFRIKWGIAVAWARFSLWAGRVFCGLVVTTEGKENIPAAPCVFLIKHTTAMEAFWQIAALPPATWVLKRELLWIPVFGWALGFVMKSIAIDRNAGSPAVKQVIRQGRDKIASGMSVCIFPEGTRMSPGETRRYGVSGAALARDVGCMIVPVAHNAGDFWPKRGLRKYPGKIRFCIGPPIDPAGRPPRETNLIAQQWVESKMAEISRIYKEQPDDRQDAPPG